MTASDTGAVGRRIKELRRRRGMSQTDLAMAMDRSASWVSQVERGVLPVERLAVLRALARVLQVAVQDLWAESPSLDQVGSSPLPARDDEQPSPLHSVSVAGAVVRDDGRVLVIQRSDNGQWELPGGVLELAEGPEQGACREVLEETGIEVAVKQLTGVYKNMVRGVVALVFRCKPIGGSERTSEESSDLAWLSPEEVRTMIPEVYAARLLDALSTDAPHVRIHDGQHVLPASPYPP